MRGPHNLWRLIRTGATFERTGAMATRARRRRRAAGAARRRPGARLALPVARLRGRPAQPPILRALTALGPAYIKFGQLLSTRPDVVGEDLARQLTVLQDKLPPFPLAEARAAIEHELGRPVDAVFADLGAPVAAASLAQVHRATLVETGQVVAVKVLRPGIERAFLRDVDAFYLAAWLVENLAPFARRLRPRAVIAHFEGVVQGELDLRMEASAAAEFQANTADDPGFRVPSVIWPASGRRVLTLEWVSGINMGDLPALQASGADLTRLSERIIQSFLTQALRDGFFHADMHQGNLKLGPGRGARHPRLRHHGPHRPLHPPGLRRDPDGLFAQGLRPGGGGAFRGGLRAGGPRHGRLRPGAALGRGADLRAGRDQDLDGAAARASLRGDRALRHADPHRADPACSAPWSWWRGWRAASTRR